MTTVDPMRIGPTDTDEVTPRFVDMIQALDRPAVLELGTKRWDAALATHHLEWAPHCSTYVMSDVEDGTDVDVVADAHVLAPFGDQGFDAVVAVSVWEHLARPWIAAQALARVLRPGGIAYVATHQTFPLHGYPSDYWRFSTEGLAVLFTDAGLETVAVGYGYPCEIIPGPDVHRWNRRAPAFLNVNGIWRRPC